MLRLVVVAGASVACTSTPSGGHIACSGGTCSTTCDNPSLAVCDNVCRDLFNDVFNCGGCGVACSPPNHGYAVCTDGRCVGACNDPRLTNCGDGCVDLTSSSGNCGACAFACGSGERCINAICVCTNPPQCQE